MMVSVKKKQFIILFHIFYNLSLYRMCTKMWHAFANDMPDVGIVKVYASLCMENGSQIKMVCHRIQVLTSSLRFNLQILTNIVVCFFIDIYDALLCTESNVASTVWDFKPNLHIILQSIYVYILYILSPYLIFENIVNFNAVMWLW